MIVKTIKAIAIAFAVMALAAIPAGLIIAILQGSAQNIIAAGAAAMVLADAMIAAWKFSLFREGQPHLTITQEIHTQPLGQSYRLVAATATLHNTSKVIVRPPAAWCKLDQTAPLNDEEVEYIYTRALESSPGNNRRQYPWWQLDQINRIWSNGELTVEPNERNPITFQFIISGQVTAIGVTTAIIGPEIKAKNPNPPHQLGWMCYTFLELPP